MDQFATIILAIVCLVLFIAAAFLAMIMRSWVKAPANRAFVRTGGFGVRSNAMPKVVMNGGAWVFGALHEITWVDLSTMLIEIDHTGQNALRTKDLQYTDIRVVFCIKVIPTVDGIIDAARTIGGKTVNAEAVKALAGAKLAGALRGVVATLSQEDLDGEHDRFMREIDLRVKGELEENGLVLESVSVLALQPRTGAESVAGGPAVPAGR